MGFRFRRTIKLIPGVRLNFGKRGASVSVGGRGANVTLGQKGTRTTVGLPGTGISHTSYEKWDTGNRRQSAVPPASRRNTRGEKLFGLAMLWLLVGAIGFVGSTWVLWFGVPVLSFFTWAVLKSSAT